MTGFKHGVVQKKEKLSPVSTAVKPTELVDAVDMPQKRFGIRSYLHQFYQSPTVEDIETAGAWYLLPPAPTKRTGLLVCRILTVVGLLMLIGGAASIVVGYTWPHERIEETIERFAIFQDEKGVIYIPTDKIAAILQDPMRMWKMAGFCTFAAGAVILALSLLIPTCAQCIGSQRLAGFVSEDVTPSEAPIRIYPAAPPRNDVTPPKPGRPFTGQKVQPASGPVPVMEEITKVQPDPKQRTGSTASADELLLGDDEPDNRQRINTVH